MNNFISNVIMHPLGTEHCRYPFAQKNTAVTQIHLDIIHKLLGEDYDPNLALEYYYVSRLMFPNSKYIGNPYNYYRSHFPGLDERVYKTHGSEFKTAFNSAIKKWGLMTPLEFLRQYEALHRASLDDSGLENGLILHGVLADAILNHNSDSPARIVIINPSASFLDELRFLKLPDYLQITCCCLDERIVEIYRSDFSLQKYQWIHTNDLLTLEFADRVLFFGIACPENTVEVILQDISSLCNRCHDCTVQLVIPTVYMKSKKSTVVRSRILDFFAVHHVLVIDRKATNIEPKLRCVLTLRKDSTCEVKFQHADLVSNRHGQHLLTGALYSLRYDTFVSSTKSLYGMYDEASRRNRKISTRKQPAHHNFAEEIVLWYITEKLYDGKFRVKAYFCDFPTTAQINKNTLKRGKRIGEFLYSKPLTSDEEIIPYLEACLFSDDDLAKNIRDAMNRKFHCDPMSLKAFWYRYMPELMKRSGYSHEFCKQLFNEISGSENPLYTLRVGESNTDDILAAVNTHIQLHQHSNTYRRKLMLQLKQIWDFAYQKNFCADRPLQEHLSKQEARRKTYHDLRETSVNKSLSAQKLNKLMASSTVNSDLRIKAILALKKDAKLTGAEIGALKWGDFIRTPVLQIYHLLLSKRLKATGTDAIPFLDPNSNRCQALSTECSTILNELRCQTLTEIISKGFTEAALREMPIISKPDDPQQGLTKNQINALTSTALKEVDISTLLLMLPEGSQKSQTDLNKYNGDLFGAHLDYSLRNFGKVTDDELAYLSGNKLVTTVGVHYCDHLHAGRQLTLHRKLDRITDHNRCETEPFVPTQHTFALKQGARVLTVDTSAHRSTATIEIDIPDDPDFVELICDCEVRFGMDISAGFIPNESIN